MIGRSPAAAGSGPPLRRVSGLTALLCACVASPCMAQTTASATATLIIQAPVTSTIAADFMTQNGIALSVVAPAASTSSVAIAVAAVPTAATGPTAQDRLLTVSAAAFKQLIPVSSIVSIIDTHLFFDSAQIDGSDNLLLVLLQYN